MMLALLALLAICPASMYAGIAESTAEAVKVGDYLLADGTTTSVWSEAGKVIGIVFATGGKMDNSNYGNSKKVIGYAVALTSTERRAVANAPEVEESGNSPWEISDYNGHAYTEKLMKGLKEGDGGDLFVAYKEWLEKNMIAPTVKNLSGWYIPSARQMLDFIGMALTFETGQSADGVEINKVYSDAYTSAIGNKANHSFTKKSNGVGMANLLSSYVMSRKGNLGLSGVTLKRDKANNNVENIVQVKDFLYKYNGGGAYIIRPVITIFEK